MTTTPEQKKEPSIGADASKPFVLKPFVEIINISKNFDNFVAVSGINLQIAEGEIFALLGSSGCGKSTLLRMLAGLETPTTGEIIIDGQDMASIPPFKRPINMMFQSYALFPHMTVEKNVAFGLKQDRVPKKQIKERVMEILKLVEMEAYAKRKSHQLSGGQMQRVALARILVKRPKLLLLDEPMAALDKKLRAQMQIELVDILEDVGVTCIMVTHDQEEAMTMASRIAVMDKGSIIQTGPPSVVYEFPNSRFTAEFIGSVNLFHGKIVEDAADHAIIRCEEIENDVYIDHGVTGTADMLVSVAIRPEKMIVTHDKPDEKYNWTQGIVEDIVYLGSFSTYYVKLTNGKRAIATQANLNRTIHERPTWEQKVYLSWLPVSGVMLTK
ncbi:polyamine ABC transporter ATP-binding protein [Desulfococcaceae bacterium HSG9]|nr:polyamine ABC transporter ATP-binding protein [Desulfococcaceae bacterium HSG9]